MENMVENHLSSNPIRLFSWDAYSDPRGSWQRLWDSEKIREQNHNPEVSQISLSRNPVRFTLRGLHSLEQRANEYKAVICLSGEVQDVVVDVRHSSSSFGSWQSFHLKSNPAEGILIPPGFAHGFLSLVDNTDLLYLMSAPFDPKLERCFRWNDPSLGISWEAVPKLISEKDMSHPLIDSRR